MFCLTQCTQGYTAKDVVVIATPVVSLLISFIAGGFSIRNINHQINHAKQQQRTEIKREKLEYLLTQIIRLYKNINWINNKKEFEERKGNPKKNLNRLQKQKFNELSSKPNIGINKDYRVLIEESNEMQIQIGIIISLYFQCLLPIFETTMDVSNEFMANIFSCSPIELNAYCKKVDASLNQLKSEIIAQMDKLIVS
ncbi:hypothetical protein D5018_20460 [Parashewanella curva]|uniref:DUF4760 domain-containing protein n=1 Tax=Parashewanella curva TaxID=2338552 RepID=A0A3L8PTU5_9GAMM|nr:hypothetical protein [Parashewanella curva]RLV57828.1 hypothetical protein D5018_20460 [Parashewanella curva]